MGIHDFAFERKFFQEGYLVIKRNNLNVLSTRKTLLRIFPSSFKLMLQKLRLKQQVTGFKLCSQSTIKR